MLRARARERDRVIRSNRRNARQRCSTRVFKQRDPRIKRHTHAETRQPKQHQQKRRSARTRARKCYNWISMRNCVPARWCARLNWFGHVCAASISSSEILCIFSGVNNVISLKYHRARSRRHRRQQAKLFRAMPIHNRWGENSLIP